MCIIIAKGKSDRLPTEKELKNSFEWNSDGAGFMYVENGHVIIDKGFMTYNSFITHYNKLLKKFNNFDNKSLVIHCRIGTSGKNNKGNTHPYPITNNPRLLHTKKLRVDIGVAHNGIIHGYGTPTGLNDTQEFIIDYLYPLYKDYKDFYKSEQIMLGIEKITGSKLAILDSNDEIYYVGNFIRDKGLNFSNNTYEDYHYSNYYSYDYNKYYNDDWYDKLYKKQEEEKADYDNSYNSYNEDYMIPLEKDWYVDIYGNGNPTIVGDKKYWYDLETLYLYEDKGDEFSMISINSIVYDEKCQEVY